MALACVLHRKGWAVGLRLHDNSERNSVLCSHMCGDSEIVFMGILGTHAIPIVYPHVLFLCKPFFRDGELWVVGWCLL